MSAAAVYYDPFDPVVMADPYPTYQALRKAAPVYWSDAGRCWVLSRHSDVTSALHDPSTFSSASGVFPTVGAPSMADLFLPMLIMTDPPRHTAMRRIVSRAFTPRRIATLEAGIQELIEGLLDDASSHETWDAVEALTAPLPAIVIADLLGVPREDRDSFRRWSTQLIQSQPQSPRIGGALEAAAALYDYFASFLAERRIRPRDDLMSALVEAEVEGQRLSEDELLGFCFLLLVAGHETTTNLLSNSLVVLAGEPDARHAMADDPQLLPRAVEELLRYDSPVQGLSRTLTRSTTMHGQDLEPGDVVLLLFGSANRDEQVFPAADRLDIHRSAEQHLALGHGVHFCLGASLARLEARSALQALLSRHRDWEVDEESAVRLQSGPIRGFATLPFRPIAGTWRVR